MNQPDKRSRHDEDDRPTAQQQAPAYATHSPHGGSGHDTPEKPRTEFTLLVAGCRGGKTSFLRLLLDTSSISPTATKEQLASVAKFVQGCNGHTSYIRPTSIDINVDIEGTGKPHQIGLHLVDTPSLDFKDEKAAEWSLSEILRNVDGRFAEGVEMDWNAQTTDRYVHLCIYFLDPDQIVPPSVPGPSAPLVPRTRTNSFSHTEQEPVILEPPLTTNPLLLRPTLPAIEIETIRRLSARVNVLPVVARADILSNERLAAVKVAIRRDLAEAGIGFGIFDMDTPYQQHLQDDHPQTKNGEAMNGYGAPLNGSATSNNNTPPTSPITPAHLRLPYALISPDIYSHSDGVARPPPSRAELVQQYTPSSHPSHFYTSNITRGKFTRSYRWGTLDVLDPSHSDFVALRAAIFHHMDTLQKYTREYLFDKFRAEYLRQQRPASHLSVPHHLPQSMTHIGSLSHGSRPILAIDTAPHQAMHRHPSLSGPRDILGGEIRSGQRPMSDSMATSASARGSSSRSTKQRTKKITVACNFCRSRKLKCDGGRPACSQCVKRSHPCDYMPQNKRRGTVRQRKGDESESDSGEERSAEHDEASASPEVASQPLSRRSSNVDKLNREGFAPLPQIAITLDRRERDDGPLPGPSSLRSKPPHHSETRSLFPDNELPHIATLSLPEPSPSTPVPMSAPTLPPLRPASEQQAAQRKRAATVPGKIPRTAANSGPKVVACNFCRARKTKCDGAHPACASCARRSLPCNYVHDSGPSGQGQKKGRRGSSSKPPVDSPHSVSPPSSRMVPTPSTANDGYDPREGDIRAKSEFDLKRPLDYAEASRAPKKMRMESSPGIP
ncbi:GTP binding protein [Lyophyllum atratum]|nr:GTP binding protein [Lyophyllum atratum]